MISLRHERKKPAFEKKLPVFKSGYPAQCNFKNGYPCKKCDRLTEHHKNEFGQEICDVCHSPVYVYTKPEGYTGFVDVPFDWQTQIIRGRDYTETFGKDANGKVIFYRLSYRRLRKHVVIFRPLVDCGVWIDGSKAYGYTGMKKLGVALTKRNP